MTDISDDTIYLPWLNEDFQVFPALGSALTEPNGLLAAGGDLSPARIQAAYRQGIFPWFEDDQPILWWSPNPRSVIYTDDFRPSRSLAKRLRKQQYEVRFNTAFEQVMRACAQPRTEQLDTWITDEMISAYCELHSMGVAHSIESWVDGELVGGLYGLAIGQVFFGESMFSRSTDSSKVAFATLVDALKNWGYPLIDCQVSNPHLSSLGAVEISRESFVLLLDKYVTQAPLSTAWFKA
ncbi:MAG: leucyl/phenylalanyl-tRNA--protein transferase [Pseudomonadales bacterium]|nr:leucyl/phenylalanyl-tRNA--protein transferase [Pseudomonadales bacterium]